MTRLGVFILWLIHFLPFRLQAWIGNAIGTVLYLLSKKRRHVGEVNLRLCFPHKTKQERDLLLQQNFRAFTRSFIERGILWWSSAERINKLIRVEGEEYFNASKGKPTIILTGHFVALDVGGSWISQYADYVDIYTNQKNKYINDLLLNKRARFGNQLLYSRNDGIRPVIKAVKECHPLCYFMDQDSSIKDSMFIPFFGVPARTMTTLPRLVDATQSTIVPCIIKVLPNYQGYEVRFYPPWENYPSGDVQADTRRVNEFIEQRVLEMPEQYYWLHKRFKSRPEGEKSVY